MEPGDKVEFQVDFGNAKKGTKGEVLNTRHDTVAGKPIQRLRIDIGSEVINLAYTKNARRPIIKKTK